MNTNVMFSPNSKEWETPKTLFNELNKSFHFTLDSAASDTNHLCERYFTVRDDALSQSWQHETVWCNPPYSRCGDFVKKAFSEWYMGGCEIVILLPVRTDTKWFHLYVNDIARIVFLRGRLKFGLNGVIKSSAPFPSMLVIYEQSFNMRGE